MSDQQQLITEEKKWHRSPVTDPDFLAEYEREKTWAPSHGITVRTSRSHRKEGLPYIEWAGEIWIHRAGGAKFIASLIKCDGLPKLRRRRARAAA